MQMTITPEIQAIVDERIRSGRYHSVEEVISAAVFNLAQRDQILEMEPGRLEGVFPGLRQKLADGLTSARAGRLVDGEALFEELENEDASNTPNGRNVG